MKQIGFLKNGIIISIFLFGVSQVVLAQKDTKPIGWKDVPSWKSIAPNGTVLSPNGKWVAYGIMPVDGDGELFLQKVGDTTLKKYPVDGATFISMAFSEDGRWIAFKGGRTFNQYGKHVQPYLLEQW